jgi:predicted nucleic acid-binding protein
VKETVILDTGVFLRILAGFDEEGRVYQKIVRRCDRVAVEDTLLAEYEDTLKRKFSGLAPYMIETRLAELTAHGKLLRVHGKTSLPQDIDDEDRHVVGAAKSAKAKYLISTNRRHLWDKREHIKNSHHVEVLRPEDYLALDG